MSKRDEYKYSTLASLNDKTTDDVHFYATVVDSSFPYTTDKRTVVTCKVVDHSLVKKGTVSEKDWVTVVFYAKNFEDLPIIQRVGDVIRVHRAQFQHFNDRKQLNVNLFYKGSWCLFIGNEKDEPLEPKVVNEEKDKNFFSHTPYNFSGKSFTWGAEDESLLKNLRKWTGDLFSKNDVLDGKTAQSEIDTAIKKKTDVDLLARVTGLKSHDAHSNNATLVDSNGNSWNANLFKKKFPHLAVSDVVRLRSVFPDNSHNLKLANHSNILHFITGAKVVDHATTVKGKATAGKASVKKEAPAAATSTGNAISTITNTKLAKSAVTNLKDLFFNPKKETGTFRAQFNVLKTDPAKSAEWSKGKKLAVKLVATDHQNSSDEKAYMIHVEDAAFFGSHTHEAARKALTTKGNWVDAILERKGKNYFVVNTKLQ